MSLFKKLMLAVTTLVLAVVTVVVPANKATRVDAASTKTVFFKPHSDWASDGAWYAVYSWDSSSSDWAKASDSDGDGIYEAEINSTHTSVIFTRMNSASTALDWENKWNQTVDLTYTQGKYWNMSNPWNSSYYWNATGSWTTLNFTITLNNGEETTTAKAVAHSTYTPEVLTKDGYTFNGWLDSEGNVVESISPVLKNVTLTASWTENSKVGFYGAQLGTKDDSTALRLIGTVAVTEEELESFDSVITVEVTKEGSSAVLEHTVETLYSSVSSMDADGETLSDTYYFVLTIVNIPDGTYTVNVLENNVVVATVTYVVSEATLVLA